MNARLRWMFYRLRSMPPAELPHRALEQLYRRIDRGGALARAATEAGWGLQGISPRAASLREVFLGLTGDA